MTDTPAAPHTPSDDPRVLAQRACEQAVALVNRFYGPFTPPAVVFAQGTNEAGDWRAVAKRAELDALTTTLRDLLARLDAAAPAPESPREERDRLYRDHVQACTDPRHKHPALDTPNDTPRFDWQAAEEGYEPCARGQRCELQLVRPGKVQCDCDIPGTDAAIARAEAEAGPARDDALARWLDGEIDSAEVVRGRARSMHLYDVAETRANALREVRERLGATTHTPEGGTDGR